MRLCIPMETSGGGAQGGGAHFIDHLRRYLDAQGIPHTRDLTAPADVLLLNAWHVPYYGVMQAWRHNPAIRLVHRVDGAGQDYGRGADVDRVQRRVSRLTDATIFQSEYCRHSTREKFSVITQDGPVVWNPVDGARFTPDGQRRELTGRIRVCYAKFSPNPRKGGPDLYKVAAAHPHIDFYLVGRCVDPPELPNLHMLGLLPHTEVAEVMRSCDVFLTFAQNEACPNVVLEALASGLPVLYLDSGANREVVGGAGLPVTVETFGTQAERICAEREKYAQAARVRALTEFKPGHVFTQYLNVMRAALDAPPRVPIQRRKRLAAVARLTQPIEAAYAATRPLRRRVVGKLRRLTEDL